MPNKRSGIVMEIKIDITKTKSRVLRIMELTSFQQEPSEGYSEKLMLDAAFILELVKKFKQKLIPEDVMQKILEAHNKER